MQRDEVLRKLRENLPELRRRFAVRSLKVFGSVARDEATETSDVDILVEFAPQARVGLFKFKFLKLKTELEALLGAKVDLVTLDAIKRRMRERILGEAISA